MRTFAFCMKYAIIAAGEGSRLAQEGVGVLKPLVKVGGETLIDRLIRIFVGLGATEVCVICRDQRVEREAWSVERGTTPLRVKVKATPSSMHSFYELSEWLDGDEPFVLTTVDTVFREPDFKRYIEVMQQEIANGQDGVMVVTPYIDDEKPLYVDVDEALTIRGFYDEQHGCRYVSGGIYGLTPKALLTLRRCIERGESRMRNFQRALITDGLKLKAFVMDKVLDVDHQADIEKAEAFLVECGV